MPVKDKINVRQFTILIILLTIGDSILVLPSISIFEAKQDAWISCLIGILVGLLVVYIFSIVGNLYPHLTLVQSMQEVLGIWFGTFMSMMFLIYPFITSLTFIREIGDFITIEMMQETPIQIIQILLISVVIMAVRLGLEVIARTGELFLPWVILFFLILVVCISPQAELDKLLPILEDGIKPVLRGSLSSIAFPFFELVVLLMIFPYVKQVQKVRRGFIQGALLGGIVLFILIVICILVLGAEQASRSMYPSYFLAKRISIGHFLERVESMLTLIWLLTTFIKVTIYFYVFNLGIAQLLKLKEYRMLTLPTGMLMIILSSVIAPNITYYNKVLSEYWPYFDMTYGLLLPLLLLGVYCIRKNLKN